METNKQQLSQYSIEALAMPGERTCNKWQISFCRALAFATNHRRYIHARGNAGKRALKGHLYTDGISQLNSSDMPHAHSSN
eukprot:3319587-Amphidinium_carterae.1